MMDPKSLAERVQRRHLALGAVFVGAFATFAVLPAAAQVSCSNALVDNVIQPLLQAAFQIGPLIAALSGIVSLVMMSQATSKDKKKKWKQRRNDSFMYGFMGVLVSGYILEFIASGIFGMGSCFDTSWFYTVNYAAHVMTALPF